MTDYLNCTLCNLEKVTKWYLDTDLLIVVDCLSCGLDNPMIVTKEHISPFETGRSIAFLKTHMLNVAIALFGKSIKIRYEMRTCFSHLHWHIELLDTIWGYPNKGWYTKKEKR